MLRRLEKLVHRLRVAGLQRALELLQILADARAQVPASVPMRATIAGELRSFIAVLPAEWYRPNYFDVARGRKTDPGAGFAWRRLLGALAHDSMEGRGSATIGGARAARFIAAEMKKAGLEPLGDSGYFQRVPVARDSVAVPPRGTTRRNADGTVTTTPPDPAAPPAPAPT